MRSLRQACIAPCGGASSTIVFLLLAIATSTHAVSEYAVAESADNELEPSMRRTFPTDILGEWRLVYAELTAVCPGTIRYLGWTRDNKGPFRISHDKIIQDGITCENADDEDRDRRFRFYRKTVLNQKLSKEDSAYRIPEKLLEILSRPGPARRTRNAAEKNGEMYFAGFEAVHRVCNGTALFRRGTTAFLMRPFLNDINIRKIPVPLTPSKKWLVMVPYKSKACLYESELNNFVQEVPSAEPEIEEPEEGEIAEETPKPAEGEVGLEGSVSNDAHCFPSDATVRLSDGSAVPISSLSIGDKVQVGPNEYSEVFMFTHKLDNVKSSFVNLKMRSGESLTLTSGHYLYANDKLVMAGSVRVADRLSLGNGGTRIVASARHVHRSGLHNPQTLHGDIVVDGFRTSTYTVTVRPPVAHGLLSPVRLLYRLFSMDLSFGILNAGSVWSLPPVCRDLLSPRLSLSEGD